MTLNIPVNKFSEILQNQIRDYLRNRDSQNINTKVSPLNKELTGIKDSYIEKLMDNKRFTKKNVQRFKSENTQINKKIKIQQKPVQKDMK